MYYNCRNTFYLYSKYSPNKTWAKEAAMYNFFFYSLLLEEAEDNSFKDLTSIYKTAFSDILENKMGKTGLRSISFEKKAFYYKKEIVENLAGKIIINCVDVEDEVIERIFEPFKEEGKTKLLIRSDKWRLPGYEEYFFKYDYKNILNLVKLIFHRRFDWAICFEEQRGMTLASLLAKRVIILCKNRQVISRTLSKVQFGRMIIKSIFQSIKLLSKFNYFEDRGGNTGGKGF
jgi:hypothetical protein